MLSEEEEGSVCYICSCSLWEPFIRCVQCQPQIELCLQCFGRGAERDTHHSNHKYEVMKNDFELVDHNWTAAQELQLLRAVSEFGFGNWVDVASDLQSKTAKQCQEHYLKIYVDQAKSPLPEFPESNLIRRPAPVICRVSEDPPRPANGSLFQQEMAGYMPARGDFTTEYDNFAEVDLEQMEFADDDENWEYDLKMSVLDAYNNVLKERFRRKRILRDHGLINLKKSACLYRRYEGYFSRQVDTLRLCNRLQSPDNHDILMESLVFEYSLRQDVKRLQNYRRAGLKRFEAVPLFERLQKRREEEKGQRHLLDDLLTRLENTSACQQWLQRQVNCSLVSQPPVPVRRTAPPLDIQGMPGFEKLTVKERELCAVVRLVPESFLEFKAILMSECVKHGSIRLAHARNIIKIDVNKTRRIFDFLVNEGCIMKSST